MASLPRLAIGAAVFAGGVALAMWWAAIGLAQNGDVALASRAGIVPRSLEDSRLAPVALLHPASLQDADIARLRGEMPGEPLAGLPYFVVGASIAAHGDLARGGQLVGAALKRNPRLVSALGWKAQESYTAGRYDQAADYAIGVMAMRPTEQSATDLLVLLSRIPQARKRIFAALGRNPDWRSGYINALSASDFGRPFVYQAIGIGNPVKVNLASERAKFLSDLLVRQDFDRAYTAWIGWLPAQALSSINYIYDGEFRGAPGAAPFNWQLTSSANITASIEPGTGLSLNFDGTTDVVAATQTVVIPAGRYVVVTALGEATGAAANSESALEWVVTCVDTHRQLLESAIPAGRSQAGRSLAFDIPADCKAQTIELRGKAQTYPGRTAVTIKSVAIRKVT